jgi:hypothetical protein
MCTWDQHSPSGRFKIEGENENEKESSEKGIEAGQREAVEDCYQDRQVSEAVTAEVKKRLLRAAQQPFFFKAAFGEPLRSPQKLSR